MPNFSLAPAALVALTLAACAGSNQKERSEALRPDQTEAQPRETQESEVPDPQERTIILVPVPADPAAEENVVPAPAPEGEGAPPQPGDEPGATILLIPAEPGQDLPQNGAEPEAQEDVLQDPTRNEQETPSAGETGRDDGSRTPGEATPDAETGGEPPAATEVPDQPGSLPDATDQVPSETRVPNGTEQPATAPTDESIFF